MTQQDGIDGADHLGSQGGALRLPQHGGGRGVLAVTGIEGRVSQQTEPAELEQGRGATEVGQLESGHGLPVETSSRASPAWPSPGSSLLGDTSWSSSPQLCIASRIGASRAPSGDSEYSTFGGTCL